MKSIKQTATTQASQIKAAAGLKDSLSKKAAGIADVGKRQAKDALKQKKSQIYDQAAAPVNGARQQSQQTLKKFTTPKFTFNLSASISGIFQQTDSIGGQRFISNTAITGGITVFNVPFNLVLTNSQTSIKGIGFADRTLFKLNFSPDQYTSMLKSQLNQYSNFKNTSLSGYDMPDYFREQIFGNVTRSLNPAGATYNKLMQYFDKPENLGRLLSANKEQLKEQVLQILNQSAPDSLQKQLHAFDTAHPMAVLQTAAMSQGQALLIRHFKADTLTRLIKQIQNAANQADTKQAVILALQKAIKAAPDSGTADSLSKILTAVAPLNNPGDIKRLAAGRLQTLAGTSNTQAIANGLQDYRTLQSVKGAKPQQMAALEHLNVLRADSITQAITGLQQQLERNGLSADRVVMLEQYAATGKMPAGAAGALSGTGYVNVFQRFFTHVNDFKLGGYGSQIPGGVQGSEVFVKGAYLDYNTGFAPVSIGFGSINDLNAVKDAAYQNSIYTVSQKIAYIGARFDRNNLRNFKVAVIGSFGNQFNNLGYNPSSFSANAVTVTLTKGFKLGQAGNLLVDLSKSATLHSNDYQITAENVLEQKAGTDNNLLTNGLFETLALTVTHQADIRRLNMSDNLYFNYAGTSYQNPAISGYPGGKKKLGGNIKKGFYRNKLNLGLRADFRETPLTYYNTDKWINYQAQFDMRYQVNNRLNVAAHYTTAGTEKQQDHITNNVYTSKKIQVDVNNTFKIGKRYSVVHLSAGEQDILNTYTTSATSRLLTLTYLQSVIFPGSTLTGTAFYNRELTSSALIGNLSSGDLTYQYLVFKRLSLSTGFTYLHNGGIARQAGLKQGVQMVSGKHIELNTYIDLRRNMGVVTNPSLYPSYRGEIQFKYSFKTN